MTTQIKNAKQLLEFLQSVSEKHSLEKLDIRCWDQYEDVIELKCSAEVDEESITLY